LLGVGAILFLAAALMFLAVVAILLARVMLLLEVAVSIPQAVWGLLLVVDFAMMLPVNLLPFLVVI
jgi:hypothetical protein